MKAILIALTALTLSLNADQKAADPFGAKKAPDSKFPGEYVGTYISDGEKIKYGLQIFALGEGKFRAIGFNGGLPGAGFKKGGKIERVEGKLAKGKKGSERIVFQNDDEEAIADLRKGRIVAREAGEVIARLKKVTREKPIIGE